MRRCNAHPAAFVQAGRRGLDTGLTEASASGSTSSRGRLRIRRSPQQGPAPAIACGLGLLLLAAGPLVTPSQGRQQTSAGAQEIPSYAITPERRALLNTIRFAEGTWTQGNAGYRTLYGGGRFASLARHPEIVVAKRYTSAAAGAYQFLPGTWNEASERLRLRSFTPHNQDQAALFLVDRRGVLAQIDRSGLTAEAITALAKEWASFPTLSGASAYGQPVKRAQELANFYRSNLESLRG